MGIARNVENWQRIASIAAGTALIAMAVKRRTLGSARTLTGLGLIARGTSGYCPVHAAIGKTRRRDDTRRVLSGARGVRVQERIVIERDAADVFSYWRETENLPVFMSDVERVDELSDDRWHWVTRGPAGMRLEWDAKIINEMRPNLIAWRSLPGADVASAGSVRFRPIDRGRTEVIVTMQYDPPGGKVGAAFGWLTGHDPAAILAEDLSRLKRVLESQPYGARREQPAASRAARFDTAMWGASAEAHPPRVR